MLSKYHYCQGGRGQSGLFHWGGQRAGVRWTQEEPGDGLSCWDAPFCSRPFPNQALPGVRVSSVFSLHYKGIVLLGILTCVDWSSLELVRCELRCSLSALIAKPFGTPVALSG